MHLLHCCTIHEYINTVHTKEEEGGGWRVHAVCHCRMSLLSRCCMFSRVSSSEENCLSRWFAMSSLMPMVSLVFARRSFMLKVTTAAGQMSDFLTLRHTHTHTHTPCYALRLRTIFNKAQTVQM